ncbi:hypothetical protein [Cochleicola gelatinilyticus]|uniref:Uncharacterized protein n=1 Tax=Cochleicola gelatinilyticus TaxID=1763537 RepID=A0A167HK05_9FLAO|nr:hypothetical protein [Cochleicola gelatinilyticus]OAB78695.1 hypothetical protein ULVI_08925 [Cochleicola gelatinilyticus]
MKTIAFALIAVVTLLGSVQIKAQVGIGNTSPMSMLDIQSSNPSDPSHNDGILIPRISKFPAVNPGHDQNGMMVFLTAPVGTFNVGFHYWHAPESRWISVGAEEWKDGFSSTGEPLIYASQAKLSGTDIIITDSGKVGIGTDTPVERFEFKGPGDNDFQITSANTNPPNVILYNTGGTLDAPTAFTNANQEIGSVIVKTHDGAGIREPGGFRFYIDGLASPGSTPSKFVVNTTPEGSTQQRTRMTIRSNGNTGIGVEDPKAVLQLKGGTTNNAPLKFTAGPVLNTPEAGTIEYDGNNFYLTAGTLREVVMKGTSVTIPLSFPPINKGRFADVDVAVSNAVVGDACNCSPHGGMEDYLVWNCYVSAPNTVTVRVSNIRQSSSAISPSTRNWNIKIIK